MQMAGACDRITFERAIDEHIALHGAACTVVGLVDINCFTEIRTKHGPDYGDSLLLRFLNRFQELFAGRVVGRIGIDTFGIVGNVQEINPGRLEEICTPSNRASDPRKVTVAISVAQASECEGTGSAVLIAATLALKAAKAKGLGGYACYSRAFGKEARQRSDLQERLLAAIGTEQIFLAYQPQISLKTNCITATEALLRWRLPSGEFIAPDLFLPLAEQSGLIIALGHQVMTWALETGHRLRERGFHIRMAVNVSIPQFVDEDFVGVVQRVLAETNSEPEHLELEITESVAGLGEKHLFDVLTKIRALGVGIAIDDFGTGYSSLAYADRLPADRLKVDRSFISSLGASASQPCIVKTIIKMGHELRWTVLAEGVETAKQANILRDMGCDEAQGFYFARPMPEPELIAWLDEYTQMHGSAGAQIFAMRRQPRAVGK